MSVLTVDGTLDPKGFEEITSLSSAQGLTPPSGARIALIQAADQPVRWRDDATDPTALVGMQLAAGKDFFYVGDLSAIKFIEGAASAKLSVSYYGG